MRLFSGLIILLSVLTSCSHTETEYYDNGKVKSEVEMQNGKKNGSSIFYYSSGSKQMECHYKDDLLDGKLSRWTYRGKLEIESYYVSGHRNGETRLYTSEGILQIVQNYKNDTLDGPIVEYFPNGQTKMTGFYSMGLFDGVWLYYEANGLLIGKGLFENGSGNLESYFVGSSKIKSSTAYQRNLRNGKSIEFNADGMVESIRYFKDDQIVDSIN